MAKVALTFGMLVLLVASAGFVSLDSKISGKKEFIATVSGGSDSGGAAGSTVQHGPTPAEQEKGPGAFCRRKGDKNSVACKCQHTCGPNGEVQEDTLNCKSKCKRHLCKCDHPCST